MRTPLRVLAGLFVACGLWSGACLGQSLEDAAASFANRWGAGEVASLEGSLSPAGVRLQWEARQVGSLDPRHAVASIREYLGRREGVSTRVTRVEEVGGEPPKGYAEIRWESRIQGTSDILARTVFVAFTSENDRWQVTELRVLPLSRS
jgi:hypothetical protein